MPRKPRRTKANPYADDGERLKVRRYLDYLAEFRPCRADPEPSEPPFGNDGIAWAEYFFCVIYAREGREYAPDHYDCLELQKPER